MKGQSMSRDAINIIMGDITAMNADAIVNAANNTLLGGGGVDGAIHRAAGPELLEECRKIGGCPTGEARITKGYRLSARWVIHTVGPIWQGGNSGEDQLLAKCYRNCFELAEKHGIKCIAFPSISTGTYGFPVRRASKIAIREIYSYISRNSSIAVTIVCFNRTVYDCYMDALKD